MKNIDWMPSDIRVNESFKEYGFRKSNDAKDLQAQLDAANSHIAEIARKVNAISTPTSVFSITLIEEIKEIANNAVSSCQFDK